MWRISPAFLRSRASRRAGAPVDALFVVSTEEGIDQVFAHSDDADTYAAEVPGSWVSRYALRRSLTEGVAVFDRWLVVAEGKVQSERESWVRRFVDDPLWVPPSATVEWFQADADDIWHITGFGTDKAELEAKLQAAVKQVSRLSGSASTERAR